MAAGDAPYGRRPYRVHVAPSDGGSGIVSAVADRMRAQLLERAGLADLARATASRLTVAPPVKTA